MRFSNDDYLKVFPQQEEIKIESAVPTFTPSADLDSSDTEDERVVDIPVDEKEGEENGRNGEFDTEQ